MAFKKLQSTVNLPTPGTGIMPTQGQDQTKTITKYQSDLAAAISMYMNDMVSAVNDLIDGRINLLRLPVQTVEPADKASGWIAYADGTVWNPGSGEGIYAYYGGAWVKL